MICFFFRSYLFSVKDGQRETKKKNNDVTKRTEVKVSEKNEEKDGKNKKGERVEVFDNIV